MSKLRLKGYDNDYKQKMSGERICRIYLVMIYPFIF